MEIRNVSSNQCVGGLKLSTIANQAIVDINRKMEGLHEDFKRNRVVFYLDIKRALLSECPLESEDVRKEYVKDIFIRAVQMMSPLENEADLERFLKMGMRAEKNPKADRSKYFIPKYRTILAVIEDCAAQRGFDFVLVN